jgi:hypothetical protein
MADSYEVQRSVTVNTGPDPIFDLIVDLRKWQRWSPWEGLDSNLERDYRGPESGVGAGYAWSGNRKAGQGEMTITEADQPRGIALDLQFLKPFKSQSVTRFDLDPGADESSTTVVWTMTGRHTLLTKLLSPIFNMDRMIGPDFEQGLANLRTAAEAEAG